VTQDGGALLFVLYIHKCTIEFHQSLITSVTQLHH
jgi:hypothetical protein